MVNEERRTSPRKVVLVQINNRTELGFLTLSATNMSQHGLFIETDEPSPRGAVLYLTLSLDDSNIKVRGQVIWSRGAGVGPEPGMGIHIIGIDPEDQKALDKFLIAH